MTKVIDKPRVFVPKLKHETLIEALHILDEEGQAGTLGRFLKEQRDILEWGNPFVHQDLCQTYEGMLPSTTLIRRLAVATVRAIDAGLQTMADRDEYCAVPMLKSPEFFECLSRSKATRNDRAYLTQLESENPFLWHFITKNLVASAPSPAFVRSVPALIVWVVHLQMSHLKVPTEFSLA